MLAVYARKTHFRRNGIYRVFRLAFYQDILANALGVRTYTPRNIPQRGRLRLINWGCSEVPNTAADIEWVGNTPEAVATLSHKRKMFRALASANVPCLEWTTDKEAALGWQNAGHTVYARLTLQGHSGKGIVRVKAGEPLPDAPLYTKAVEGKFREYRVHVFDGEIVSVQQKKRMSDGAAQAKRIRIPDAETRAAVRTYRNGWVFCVDNVTPLSENARKIAIDAISACGAKAGATDLLTQGDKTLVIETNSAPALRSPSVKAAYTQKVQEVVAHD